MGSQIGALFKGLWGDAGQEFVDLQGGPDKVFGTKPDVAPYKPIDLGAETTKAVSSNLENLPDIMALLDKAIPGFTDLISTGTSNALALERGQLPQTDVDALRRSSAFKALQGGFGGTPMSGALSLRDLGIGTLQGQMQGANLAQQMTQLAEGAYSPFTISTGQQAGTTAANNAGLQAQKQFQFNVNAAPDPGAAGIYGLDKELGMQMLSFGMGAAGGAIAGGGGAGIGGATQGAGGYPQGSTYQPYDWRQNAMGSSSGSNYYVAPAWQGVPYQYPGGG